MFDVLDLSAASNASVILSFWPLQHGKRRHQLHLLRVEQSDTHPGPLTRRLRLACQTQ
jgi:hypothetical protein